MKVMPPEITEYIYVNGPRLDAYFEQISSPVAYDKVPSIDVRLRACLKNERCQVPPRSRRRPRPRNALKNPRTRTRTTTTRIAKT